MDEKSMGSLKRLRLGWRADAEGRIGATFL